jgi:hemerythrin-like domain-containing protein
MRAIVFSLLFGSIVMSPYLGQTETSKASLEKPSEHFRKEHLEMKKHLAHVEDLVGNLGRSNPEEQKKKMMEIVSFFQVHIKPHAEWEEEKLYPAVDKRTCKGSDKGSDVFTATMRHEHKIIGRWIDEIASEANSKSPNAQRFSRKTDQLLGLINGHFEEEEEVLLPILDRSMTREEFEQEILSRDSHSQ